MEKTIKTTKLPNSTLQVILSTEADHLYHHYIWRKSIYDRLCESDASPTTRKLRAKEDMDRALLDYHSELKKCQPYGNK